jgi:hypothetical protein
MAFGGDDWKTLYFTSRNHLGSVIVKIPGVPMPVRKRARGEPSLAQRDPSHVPCKSTYEPPLVQDCEQIGWRYDQAAIAIRRDLEAPIAAADRATIAQAGAGYR